MDVHFVWNSWRDNERCSVTLGSLPGGAGGRMTSLELQGSYASSLIVVAHALVEILSIGLVRRISLTT